ncbi:MAG: HAMP domain-containing protein [Candidatus Staskawiczbacteria bacterium]|jgi:methyl-accepting chemotaxis protein
MQKTSFKVALPVILAGMFSIVVFLALNPEGLEPSFYIILFLLSIFIFFYGLHIGQSVAMPVKKILKRAIDLSKGDLKTRFYLETKDEFGELAQIFNKIADDLEQSRMNAENSEKSVGIKVKAKTQDLEETINALEQKVKNRTVEIEKLMQESARLQNQIKTKEVENTDLSGEISKIKSSVPSRAPKKEIVTNSDEVIK